MVFFFQKVSIESLLVLETWPQGIYIPKKKEKKKREKRKVHGGKGRCGAPAERAELRTLLIASSQTRLLIRPVVLNTSPSGSHVLLGLLGTSGIAKRKRQKGFICIHRIDYGKEIKAFFGGKQTKHAASNLVLFPLA